MPTITIAKGLRPLSEKDFQGICELVRQACGINLGPEKRTMIEGRLTRRLRARNLDSYAEYCRYLFSGKDQEELVLFINAVTTNKTDFFREPRHFELLTKTVLPELSSLRRPICVWSACCSTGEEPYTMAMVLSEYQQAHPGFSFRILATDISTDVLERATDAIYSAEAVKPIAIEMRQKYLLRSRERSDGRVRIAPELRHLVTFERMNLMDEDYSLDEEMQIIFCRNALIYFDRPTQEEIVGRLLRYLVPGGYLFIGHSENLNRMNLPVIQAAPAVYRKRE